MIVHVVAGLGRSQGGPSYSVPRLCSTQTEAGADVRLCAVDDPKDPPFGNVNAELFRQDYANVPVLKNLRASKSLRSHLLTAVPDAAIVHAHGLWLLPNVLAGKIAQRSARPLVVSPRGMLADDALRISRVRKLAFWKFLQQRAYAEAALWHATCDEEAIEIRHFGIRAPIAVIPNGVDVPLHRDLPSPRERSHQKTVLYMGRIHPKKGLPRLVEAWAMLAVQFPQWRLRIVGPDEVGHADELRRLADRLGAQRVSIDPAVYGDQKSEAFSEASLFVLPTLNENFGIAVAEALGAAVPAIVTKGAPWSGLETEKCGWWIEHGATPLASVLDKAMRMAPEELRAMGERGRAWMLRDFSWSRIARDMLVAYDWVGHGGPPPSNVRLD